MKGKHQDRNKAGKFLLDADTLGPCRKVSKTRGVAPGHGVPRSLLWRPWRERHSHPPLPGVHLLQVTAQHQICDAAKRPTHTKRSSCTHDQNMTAVSGFNVVPSCVIATHCEVVLRRGVLSNPITPCLHSSSPPGYRLTIYGTCVGDLPAEHLKHGVCGYHDVSLVPSDVYETLRVQARGFRL